MVQDNEEKVSAEEGKVRQQEGVDCYCCVNTSCLWSLQTCPLSKGLLSMGLCFKAKSYFFWKMAIWLKIKHIGTEILVDAAAGTSEVFL